MAELRLRGWCRRRVAIHPPRGDGVEDDDGRLVAWNEDEPPEPIPHDDVAPRWFHPSEISADIAPERPKRRGEHRAETVLLRVRSGGASGVGSERRFTTLGLLEAHVDATYTREIGAVRLIRPAHTAHTAHSAHSAHSAHTSALATFAGAYGAYGADDRPQCPVSGAEFVHLASEQTELVAQRRWMRRVEVVQGPPDAEAVEAVEAVPLEDWLAARGEAIGGANLAGTRALVWWPADGACYPCTVERFHNVGGNVGHHGAHAVRYDDGQRETVHLALQTYAPLEPVPLDEGPEETEGADGGADGGAETQRNPRIFDRVCWFAARGVETAHGWRRERGRRAGRRTKLAAGNKARGGDRVDGNAPGANVGAGTPHPNEPPTASPEEGGGKMRRVWSDRGKSPARPETGGNETGMKSRTERNRRTDEIES